MLPDVQIKSVGHARAQCHHTDQHAHFIVDMTSLRQLFLVVASIVSVCSKPPEDICVNQWDVSVEGLELSELAIHHSSTVMPGQITHLIWHWEWQRQLSGTFWLTQHKGYFQGGFISHAHSPFHLPASFMWSLANRSLGVTTHGDITELTTYPEWSVSLCQGLLVWGVTSDKELHIMYDGVNETRSLDESWAVDGRLKRQVEFPTLPQQFQSNGTLATWWRHLMDTLQAPAPGDDRARSWIMDLTEMLLKLIFSGFRSHRQLPQVPSSSDAEVVPDQRFRDIETLTESSRPFRFPKNIRQPNL